jgi:hypothetical protein
MEIDDNSYKKSDFPTLQSLETTLETSTSKTIIYFDFILKKKVIKDKEVSSIKSFTETGYTYLDDLLNKDLGSFYIYMSRKGNKHDRYIVGSIFLKYMAEIISPDLQVSQNAPQYDIQAFKTAIDIKGTTYKEIEGMVEKTLQQGRYDIVLKAMKYALKKIKKPVEHKRKITDICHFI